MQAIAPIWAGAQIKGLQRNFPRSKKAMGSFLVKSSEALVKLRMYEQKSHIEPIFEME